MDKDVAINCIKRAIEVTNRLGGLALVDDESLMTALAALESQAEKELSVPAKHQTIAKIVEEVCEEICDHYCKWPEQYTKTVLGEKETNEDALITEKCDKCPLNRL